jgi:hypothetical protein
MFTTITSAIGLYIPKDYNKIIVIVSALICGISQVIFILKEDEIKRN